MKAWLVDSTNNVRMDYIARYENLQADFDQITKLIGIPPQALPTENVSQLKSKREAALAILHNDDLRELITDYFADDFEEFEYSTDFSNSDSFELYCRKK